MECSCRFQLGDMGYYECQLEKGHEGNHSFSHDGKSRWPRVAYKLEWEQDAERDIIFTEEMLEDTTLKEICIEILETFDVKEISYNYEDDSLHGETPILWISAKYKYDSIDSEEFYTMLGDLEYEIREFIDDRFMYNGKLVRDYKDLLCVLTRLSGNTI